jgi:hypothetical protein
MNGREVATAALGLEQSEWIYLLVSPRRPRLKKTCRTRLLAALNERPTDYSGTIIPIRYHEVQRSSHISFGTGAIPTGLPFGVAATNRR